MKRYKASVMSEKPQSVLPHLLLISVSWERVWGDCRLSLAGESRSSLLSGSQF